MTVQDDLPALFPDASPEQLDRIWRATERLHPAGWMASVHHVTSPIGKTGSLGLLLGTIPLGEDPDDPVELELYVSREAQPAERAVSATLGVSCWCRQDHNMHYLRDVEMTTTSSEELTTALETIIDLMVQWRGTVSRDPEWWRAEAGLPLRRP